MVSLHSFPFQLIVVWLETIVELKGLDSLSSAVSKSFGRVSCPRKLENPRSVPTKIPFINKERTAFCNEEVGRAGEDLKTLRNPGETLRNPKTFRNPKPARVCVGAGSALPE